MSFLRAALLAATLAAPAAAQMDQSPGEENPWVSPLVDDLIYGIYCAEEPVGTEEAPETASGVVNIVPELPDMRLRQFVVPAARDIGFGVLVRLQDGLSTGVTVTVTHPPFLESGVSVERWHTTIDGDGHALMGFTFDTDEEEVPGEWTFSAEAEGQLLYHVAFQVVPRDAAPQVLSLCAGGFVS